MKRIEALFSVKKRNILSMYCTAGFPKTDSITEVLHAFQKHGADMAEIGIPYSDPLADGPVIQQSNMVALKNGMTIKKLFEQLKNVRSPVSPPAGADRGGGVDSSFPLILMGYVNPVLQYGFEKFCEDAKAVGVDGIILPDLPMYEYETEYRQMFIKNELDFIFLVTPETSKERIEKIDKISTGFIYAVSSSSTTGKDIDLELQRHYLKKLQQMNLKNPVLVGFGIRNKQTFRAACEYTNGAIIASAYIKALQNSEDINSYTEKFLNGILK